VLALSLWLAGALALFVGCNAQEQNPPPAKLLTEAEAGNAEFVAQWLKQHGATADQKEARQFLEQAQQAKQRKNWSAATKAFGESMIRYPNAQALAGYAEAELRMLGEVRARDKSTSQHMAEDMKHALAFYEAALAANAVQQALPAPEMEQLRKSVACLAGYVASTNRPLDCSPIELYSADR
jgi:hypothetical protein